MYAGLDVSLRSCALCIVDEMGAVRQERELTCEVEAIADALARFPNPDSGGPGLWSSAYTHGLCGNPKEIRVSGHGPQALGDKTGQNLSGR